MISNTEFKQVVLAELANLESISENAEIQLTDEAIEKYRYGLTLYRSGVSSTNGWFFTIESSLKPFLDSRLSFVLATLRSNTKIKEAA